MLSNQEISKFLSFVLRHKPQEIQLNMDEQGWVLIQALIDQARRIKKVELTYSQIQQVVANNNKQRFKLSEVVTILELIKGIALKLIWN
jgi:putative RNA 2'-phosphotransferase